METSITLINRRQRQARLRLLQTPEHSLSLDQAPAGWDLEALRDEGLYPEPPLSTLRDEVDIPL